jgi:hypothetical protein
MSSWSDNGNGNEMKRKMPMTVSTKWPGMRSINDGVARRLPLLRELLSIAVGSES